MFSHALRSDSQGLSRQAFLVQADRQKRGTSRLSKLLSQAEQAKTGRGKQADLQADRQSLKASLGRNWQAVTGSLAGKMAVPTGKPRQK
jgi:hypothetical protein